MKAKELNNQFRTNKLRFLSYRLSTILKSLKVLYSLPKEKVDAFIASYEVYNYDWADQNKLIAELGPQYETKIKQGIKDWYQVINYLCAIGEVEKMYIPPAMDSTKSLIQNQNLLEEKVAKDLGLKKGSRVLDIGCGRGRIAHHMASMTGAHVTGINIDTTQLDSARKFAEKTGFSEYLDFRLKDLDATPYPFEDQSLDACYEIQVFSISKDIPKVLKEIYRILKPGAKFLAMEWVLLDKYEPDNSYHQELLRRIKPLIGAIRSPSVQQYKEWFEQAGFVLEAEGEPGLQGFHAAAIDKADRFFTRVTKMINRLVRWKLIPRHFKTLFDRLNQDGEAFVEANDLGIVTANYAFLVRKP